MSEDVFYGPVSQGVTQITNEPIVSYPPKIEKTYTLAALEQARKQGAEDERARCDKIILVASALISKWDSHLIDGPEKLEKSEHGDYWSPSAVMLESSVVAELREAIRALGPISETREETERRVRRETVEACGKAFDECFAVYLSIHGCNFDGLRAKLNVIAEGK